MMKIIPKLKKKIKEVYIPLIAGLTISLNFAYIGFVAMAPGGWIYSRERSKDEERLQERDIFDARIEKLRDLEIKIMQKAELNDGKLGLSFQDKVKLAKDFGYEGEIREDYEVRHPMPFLLFSYSVNPVIFENNSRNLRLIIMGKPTELKEDKINNYLEIKK